MSAKEDIARMLEEVWTDETSGAAFQKSLADTARFDLNHTVRRTLQGMMQNRIINEIAKPYIDARVKEIEPQIKANLDTRLLRVLTELETQLPEFLFEASKHYALSWMADAANTLADKIRSAVYLAFDKVKKAEEKEKTTP